MKYVFTLVLFVCISIAFAQAPNNNLAIELEKGIAQFRSGNTDSAENLLASVADKAIRENNIPIYVKAKMNTGRILGDKGDNVNALKYYHQALEKAESINDKFLIASVLKNIGVLYVSWKKFDEAFSYYDKAEKIAAVINNEELVADCENNKGIVYEQQGKYSQAILVYKNALDVYTKNNISEKIAMALSNLAIVYKYQKNYQESLKYNFMALSLSVKNNDKWSMAATNNNIGNLYGEIGDYKNAIAYCDKALIIAKEIDAKEIIESIYDSEADAAAKAGDYKSAFEYHKLFSATKDEFINIESTRQLSELNVKYELEKKQKLIQQQQFQITKRNYWIGVFSIALLLLVIMAYLIFRNIQHKQQRRLQNESIKQQEAANQALFVGEQNERIRIARDLHDSIGQRLSVMKMKLSLFPESKEVNEIELFLDETLAEIRNISHNLIPEALHFGLIKALKELCQNTDAKGSTSILLDASESLAAYPVFSKQEELSVYRIIQEILSNTLKHAEASVLNIHLSYSNNVCTIITKDNGKGFETAGISTSKGIGWKNIFARVNLLGGKIKINAEKLKGTQIDITVPLHERNN